jgi:putative holliday junction resolvase
MVKKRIAGIDFGMTRIGVALSDPSHIIASPVHTLQNQKKMELTVKALLDILKDRDVEEIVVGMPYRLNGQHSFSTDETIHFVTELKKQSSYTITTWDERLTTVQVERSMKAASMSRKKRAKVIDAACATLILQSYLDQKENSLLPSYA